MMKLIPWVELAIVIAVYVLQNQGAVNVFVAWNIYCAIFLPILAIFTLLGVFAMSEDSYMKRVSKQDNGRAFAPFPFWKKARDFITHGGALAISAQQGWWFCFAVQMMCLAWMPIDKAFRETMKQAIDKYLQKNPQP